jgi:hypothetical protein
MNIEAELQDWYNQNAPFGRELGYPECCIKAFCNQPPSLLTNSEPTQEDIWRYLAGCINGQFTGFIPCTEHAISVLNGEITLASLIKSRNPGYPPFPNF